jgi:tagatose-1,6-bisphosphate aldolase
MSNPIDRHSSAKKKERLLLQRESLRLMLVSHMDWMQSTHDPETHHVHQKIADLLQEVASTYGMLLDSLQAQDRE